MTHNSLMAQVHSEKLHQGERERHGGEEVAWQGYEATRNTMSLCG